MSKPEPTDAEIHQARNTVAIRNLCEITKEIVGSFYGQVLPQGQVVDLCTRIEAVGQHLVGKTTLPPPSGSPSITSSQPSKQPHRHGLSKCPFCDNGRVELQSEYDTVGAFVSGWANVHCGSCQCHGPTVTCELASEMTVDRLEESAIELWNTPARP